MSLWWLSAKTWFSGARFLGAKDFPLFSNLFLGVNCDQKDVGRVVSCGRDLEGLIVRDGEDVAQGQRCLLAVDGHDCAREGDDD